MAPFLVVASVFIIMYNIVKDKGIISNEFEYPFILIFMPVTI